MTTNELAALLKDPLLIQVLREALSLEVRRRPEFHGGEPGPAGNPYICLCLNNEILCSLGPHEMQQFNSNDLWTDT